MDWVKHCSEYEVSGYVGRGRGRNTWKECVENDLKRSNLNQSIVADRESGAFERLTRASMEHDVKRLVD